MSRTPKPERVIVCAQCGIRVKVGTPTEQRRRKFCSRRCAGKTHVFTRDMSVKGAYASRDVRRKQAIAKLRGLTSIEIARVMWGIGYSAGYRAGDRAAIKRLTEAA